MNDLYGVVRVIARLNVGGPAIHVINLAEGMRGRYATLLVAGHVDASEADMTPAAQSRDVDLHPLGELGRRISVWQDLVALAKLYRLFRRIRPAIVHTHTAKAGTLGRVAAVAAGVPIRVHTFHGHVLRGYFSPARTRLVIAIERLLARMTTRIVTVSEGQARELVEEFGICSAEKMRVVPLGFDFRRIASPDAAMLGEEFRKELASGGAPVVTIVGRLVPIKDHALLLDAAAELAARGRSFVLAIVGGGPEEDRLRARAAELQLADHVRFLGWRDDLARIYAGSDVVALSSINEGTPVCLIEALAAGRAVISTDVGGVRDVLEDGRLGLIVSRDPRIFADGLDRLLSDAGLRERLGRAGADAVRERFGVDRLLSDMTALYDEMLLASNHS